MAIEDSLRSYLCKAFDTNSDTFLDTFDTVILQKNLTQEQKDASLLWSSWTGSVTLMASLLSNGANVNFCDEEGRSSLHLACCKSNLSCVKILLNHGAKINTFDKQKLAAPLFCAVAASPIGGQEASETVSFFYL